MSKLHDPFLFTFTFHSQIHENWMSKPKTETKNNAGKDSEMNSCIAAYRRIKQKMRFIAVY